MAGLKQFWQKQNTLERKLFWSILVLVAVVASFSAVFTIYEGFNVMASLSSVGCTLVCIAVAIIAVRTSLYDQCYLALCCVLSCILLPLLFVFCGGISSGMPLYLVAAFALQAFAKRSPAKALVFVMTLLIQVCVFLVTWSRPDLLSVTLNRDESYLDIVVSLVMSAVTVFAVGVIFLKSYAKERREKEILLEKLDDLSKRDFLTGLYNHRYLMNFMENVVWRNRERFYLLEIEVDDFGRLNTCYGRSFGDLVLKSVADMVRSRTKPSSGECVARLEGGAFVCLLTASSESEALTRAETIRRDISSMRFEQNSLAQVTVCGGFVACGDGGLVGFESALEKAEELMGVSKSLGKNIIRSLVRS